MSLKPKEVDFGSTWTVLQETVKNVITLQPIPRPVWNDRFSDVYALCVANPDPYADRLYTETKDLLEMHVRDMCSRVSQQGKMSEGGLLQAYFDAWMEYRQGIVYLSRLYSYLNQQHIRKAQLQECEINFGTGDFVNASRPLEILDLGLETWKNFMVEPLREKLVRLLLEKIEEDRMGKPIREVVQLTIFSFVEIHTVHSYRGKSTDYYDEIFEKPFLEATGEFYKREAARLMQECTLSQYLEKVQQRLSEEFLRLHKFIPSSTFPKAKAKCEEHFVSDHFQALQAECENVVREERINDLRNIYPLLRAVPNGCALLAEKFLNHVYNQGLNAINDLHGDNVHMQFVENMLAVHTKYSQMVEDIFGGDSSLSSAMDRACAQVINYKPNPKVPCRSSELLAKYCDTLLKKSSKGISESEIETKLTQSIIIFRYIDDKDIYQKFYSMMLARRLIHQQSHSMDAEEAMINRLKQACGFEFTNKLHRMYTDISLSADLNVKFQDHLNSLPNVQLGINFQINVLQAGAWPLGQGPSSFIVPQELVKSIQQFEDFYKQCFNGRRLTWYPHLCQGDLKLSYLPKTYIISMQTFQLAILLLFEKSNELSGQELMDGVALPPETLCKQMQSLVDAKLLLDPGEKFSTQTVYRLNLEYSNKRTRFKISGAQQRETAQEVQTTLASVEEDRKLVLQAAIVRIMKSRKILKHNDLLRELLSQKGTAFQPSVQVIKKCIEALIDKQYIERTANSQDEYSYVA